MKINEVLEREEVQDGRKAFQATDGEKTVLLVVGGEVYEIKDYTGAGCFHRWQPTVADLICDFELSEIP